MSPSSPLIAVTGINGFIATEVVLLFLSKGWTVRGTVRTPAQADKLKTHPAYEKYCASGELEVLVVEDLAQSDLSALLDGVDAVASVAAPLPKFDNPNLTWADFKGPTIDPVLRVLQYAKKSTTIKAVAIMSSSGSSFDLQPPPDKVYSEKDWTPYTEELSETITLATNPMAPLIWYFTSKKLAEQAVIRFQETEKPSFSIATFAPAMVYGPAHQIPFTADLKTFINGSSDEFFGLFKGKDQPLPSQFAYAYADVRDVADAFYAAITKQVSGKFMLSGHEYTWQALADKLRELRPDLDAYFPLGEPGAVVPVPYTVDNSKSKKELGLEYRSIEETLKGTVEFYEALGIFKEAPIGAKQA
ncbi:hypothetical protein IAR50_006953 [Cryptococcus sp. DSM 104548]